jgi:hypothetical protein
MIRKPCQWENPKKKKKTTQVVDMETLAKTILIFAFYDFLTEKKSFLNKNSINY